MRSKSFNCRGLDCGFSGLGKLSTSSAFCLPRRGFDFYPKSFVLKQRSGWMEEDRGKRVGRKMEKQHFRTDKGAPLHACLRCLMPRERSATDTTPPSLAPSLRYRSLRFFTFLRPCYLRMIPASRLLLPVFQGGRCHGLPPLSAKSSSFNSGRQLVSSV